MTSSRPCDPSNLKLLAILAGSGVWSVLGVVAIAIALIQSGFPGRNEIRQIAPSTATVSGAPGQIMTVTDGDNCFWVRTIFKCHVARFDGQAWEAHRTPFEEPGQRQGGPIAAGTSGVFVSTHDRLWQLVNNEWKRFELPTDVHVDRLLAVDQGCYALSQSGDLWFINDGHWKPIGDGAELETSANNINHDIPFFVDASQNLWHGKHNVHRFRNGRWESISKTFPQLEDATCLGATAAKVVFSKDGELFELDLETDSLSNAMNFREKFSFSDDERPLFVRTTTAGPALATTSRVLSLDGSFPESRYDDSEVTEPTIASGVFHVNDQWYVVSPSKPDLTWIWCVCIVGTIGSIGVGYAVGRILPSKRPIHRSAIVLALLAFGASLYQLFDQQPIPRISPIVPPIAIYVFALTVPIFRAFSGAANGVLGRLNETIEPTPIIEKQLLGVARPYLENMTVALSNLGFDFVRDFQLKKNTFYVTRVLQNSAQNTMAEITVVKKGFGLTKCVGFVSLISDGTVVETANIAVPTPKKRFPQLLMNGCPNKSLADLWQEHQAILEEMIQSPTDANGERHLMQIGPDLFEQVILYSQKLLHEQLRLDGVVTGENPYSDAEFPMADTLVALPCHGRCDGDGADNFGRNEKFQP